MIKTNDIKNIEINSPGLHTKGLSYAAARIVAQASDNETPELITRANDLRLHFKKNNIFTCGIINAKSGFCSQDCAFCAQSVHYQTGAETYPLINETQIIEKAIVLSDAGATRFSIVTSGFMLNHQEMDTICKAVTAIHEKTDLIICTSIGTLTPSMAKRLKQSGVTNCHHNLETARSFFNTICTTHDYNDDIETIKIARSAGLKICSGGIMGLGENWEQRVELAFTLKALDVDSIPINFLNPIPGTALEKQPLLSPLESLKCIALFRLINPDKDIVICGGRETALRDDQPRLFSAGANGLMIGNYLTTLGRQMETDMEMIRNSGLTVV
ncbi:MAG: biotin synthase BioB [Candidatus Magnetomorum sp.]|nr:biotin synthase BioB [Candidatus Magnetomorum sp.]